MHQSAPLMPLTNSNTPGFAKQRYQNSRYQRVGLDGPGCILSRLGPSRDNVVVDQALRKTRGGGAASRSRPGGERRSSIRAKPRNPHITGRLKNARSPIFRMSSQVASGSRRNLAVSWNTGAKYGQERAHLRKNLGITDCDLAIWHPRRAICGLTMLMNALMPILINTNKKSLATSRRVTAVKPRWTPIEHWPGSASVPPDMNAAAR